ncbi:hypothetical protein ACOJQI_18100 [Bacillus salacetis]|uniref:hypothetical protein n=1 Tax=Bacillus salacetis TaxID=2315464 RepID=UPI003BA2DE71
MNSQLEDLKKSMDATTHKGDHFTEAQKQNIKSAIHSETVEKRNPNSGLIFLILTAAAAIMIILFSAHGLPNLELESRGSNPAVVDNWEIRDEYVEKNIKILNVYPEPELTAGRRSGYIFSFQEPFETYKGKKISINALNKDTGEKINVLAPEKITEPSPGYSSLQRFTAGFEIPYGGLWKLEVLLDGDVYGDVVLSVGEKQDIVLPDDIPAFVQEDDFEEIDWERKANNFRGGIIGNENKSGVIGADMPSLTPQKWMWHLWGNQTSELTVVGLHRKSQTVHPILDNGWAWTMQLGGAVNGADAHVPTAVTIPKPGEWAFLLYDGEELFDVLVMNIEE